jgi:mRNA-degrading endonuclease toxin of MazEF toxin-antitoxin module
LNAIMDDTILVQITSTSRGLSTEVVLDPAVEVNSGLRMLSVAVCSNVLTLDKSWVNRRLGSLSSTAMHQIEAGVNIAIALP